MNKWAIVILNLIICNQCYSDGTYSAYQASAHFRVSNRVVTPNLQAFAATLPGIGNSQLELESSNSGFEPIVYRNRYVTQRDAIDRIETTPEALTNFDSLREGFLDNADYWIYRVENGAFRLVHEGRIPEGGSHASGWIPINPTQRIVPANTTNYLYYWDGWNRKDVPYYFTVRAISREGRLSAPADAVSFFRPSQTGRNNSHANSLMDFRPPHPVADDTSIPAPRGLRGQILESGALLLEWQPPHPSSGIAGYVVYRSDYPPQKHSGFYLEIATAGQPANQRIRKGDVVFVSKKFYSASRNRYFTNRVWGAEGETSLLLPNTVSFFADEVPGKTWQLVKHDHPAPVVDAGETYLKVTLAEGQTELIGRYNHSGRAQDWYPVLEPRSYRVEALIRKEGNGSARFKLEGFYGKGAAAIAPIKIDAGKNWRLFKGQFKPTIVQEGAQPARMGIELTGPGTFHIDNVRVYREDAEFLDLLPEQKNDLKAAALSSLRTHGQIKTKFRTYDMEQLTNDGGAISGSAKSNSLPQLLRIMRKVGVRPWLQIEFHMHPKEWLGFVEYMAAPYDPTVDTPLTKPWAYKRYQQGQRKPWVDEFDQIYFELGNETWNSLFRPWVFGEMVDGVNGKKYNAGQSYGLFQEHVISLMRSSPYWARSSLDSKFVFVIGGWNALPYGRDAAAMSPSSGYLTVAAYNGGWDEGEGPPKQNAVSFFNLMSQVSQVAIPNADLHLREVQELNRGRRAPLRIGTYEGGPGYALNGLNNARVTPEQAAEQEMVMKSLAAGTATLDAFLARAYRGFDLQTYFGFRPGSYWASHAPWHKGGHAYPSWLVIALFNNHAVGDMLETETLSVPTADLRPYDRRPAVRNAPQAVVYATRTKNRHVIFVISRKIPNYPFSTDAGFTPVTIELPFKDSKKLTLHRLAGDPYANSITSPKDLRVEEIMLGEWQGQRLVVNQSTGGDVRGLPPASVYMYVFDGVSSDSTH